MISTAGAIIQTTRLILDPLRDEDTPTVFAYRSDPASSRYQGWKPTDEAEVAQFIADQRAQPFGTPDSWCQLAIRHRASGDLLGDFGAHFPPTLQDPIEFGLSLRPDAQRQGFARESMEAAIDMAFNRWGYRRVVASVDPRNTASAALCRALGMRQEAHHVESYLFRGEWVDDVVFALLAREWRK
ncbi:GNAT family N-acetyltransferase [Pinirhizobacter soli]|uniref:GNAT family N-acetyltransferase n=1 Tax=Pinirhizobacter soli TaxID=2786953 RepID=UPI00202A06EA|nr:GNAT family protein [Pinirhizobacter soli]